MKERSGALGDRPQEDAPWDGEFLRAGWGDQLWLRHGFSTRKGGVSTVYGDAALNLGYTKEDRPEAVRENRRRMVAAVLRENSDRSSAPTLVTARQVHSATIKTVRERDLSPGGAGSIAVPEADALITDVPGALLGVVTADCVPVLVVDGRRRAVAAIHAGWRGTVQRIAEKAVDRMRAEFGSRPEDLVAAIGPAIGPCCYVVGEEVQERFGNEFPYAAELFSARPGPEEVGAQAMDAGPAGSQTSLNLWEANRRQLLDAGICSGKISVLGECTACAREADGSRRFFSYRAENGVTGRMLSVVGIAPENGRAHTGPRRPEAG